MRNCSQLYGKRDPYSEMEVYVKMSGMGETKKKTDKKAGVKAENKSGNIAGSKAESSAGSKGGNKAGKTPAQSGIETAELVLPNDTNLLGNLLGGRLMHWIDITGAMAASRHSNSVVATVALDSLDFRHPVRKGELVILKAFLTWVGTTSMEVAVEVFAENVNSGNTILTNKAFVTYVALDEKGMPTPVPPLILTTREEIKMGREALVRREERLKRKGN